MLDIKFIRENPGLVRDAVRKKRITFDVEALITLDDARRAKLTAVEAMRAELNTVSDAIPKIQNENDRRKAIEGMRDFKKKLSEEEHELHDLQKRFEQAMYEVPNVPDPSVPDGNSDADNQEIRKGGTKPEFSFIPKDHMTLLKDLDLADFERGVKISGFRGYVLKREAAVLSIALWQFALQQLIKKGFIPLIAPSLVREDNFIGTGYLPQGKDEIYKTQDDLALVGTAEVSVMGMYQDEILDETELPKKFVAFSPGYRREAGAYGKDAKGLYRVHEIMKVEQVILLKADHVESVQFHEELTKNSEELLEALGLHYRVVINAGGDLGLGQVKKYDVETWMPSQNKFGETHSSSYFHDFQTRRLHIRYRDEKGVIHFAHSLNNTAIATPRILIGLLEQYQREDGSVAIPEALWQYTGIREIRRG